MNYNSINKLLFSGSTEDVVLGCHLLSRYTYDEIIQWYSDNCTSSLMYSSHMSVNGRYISLGYRDGLDIVNIKIKEGLYLLIFNAIVLTNNPQIFETHFL